MRGEVTNTAGMLFLVLFCLFCFSFPHFLSVICHVQKEDKWSHLVFWLFLLLPPFLSIAVDEVYQMSLLRFCSNNF